jgi:hypothetical protein
VTDPGAAGEDVVAMPPRVRAWGFADAAVATALLGILGPWFLIRITWRVPGEELRPWLEQDFVGPAAVGAALGLGVGGIASLLQRRVVIWWVPAGFVGAVFAVGATGNAVLVSVVAALMASVLVRSACSRGRSLLMSDRLRPWCIVAATIVTVGIGSLLGVASVVYTEPTDTYRVLRADPMAADRQPGLELHWNASADQGTFETTAPQVKTSWLITDGTSQPEVMQRLGRYAASLGWEPQPGDEWCGFRRTTDGVQMCLEIRQTAGPEGIYIEIWPEHWTPE